MAKVQRWLAGLAGLATLVALSYPACFLALKPCNTPRGLDAQGSAAGTASAAGAGARAGVKGSILACLASGLLVAGLCRVARQARQAEPEGQKYKPEDWAKRVKFVEGDRAVFDVTIPKPLGLIPADFPNRPGVGVAKITPDGNTDLLNKRVIVDGQPGMWVLEGDEIVAVNGQLVEGLGLEQVSALVKASEGSELTLTLCRYYMASPVKVVFMPSGQCATMKRGVEIRKAADIGVQEVSYSCKEGWCKACWHTDPMFGTVYRACNASSPKKPAPKNPRTIPATWNSVVPLWLLNWKDSMKLLREAKAQEKAEAEAEAAAAKAAQATP